MPPDLAGAKDHPVLSRYAGSWLVGEDARGFGEVLLPSSDKGTARLEGTATRLYYLGPAGRSALEVQRNYEEALARAGAKRIDACASACGQRRFDALRAPPAKVASGRVDGWNGKTLTDQWQDGGDTRYWYGTLDVGGRNLHIAVLTAPPGIMALRDKHAATVVQIVEVRPMEGGQVTVDAAALGKGLQAQGRIALYGLFFDTGKADIKPASQPQLDEMGKLLQSQPALKVYVVGHTDNQGTLQNNLALSRQRAQAVVDALVKSYRIDPQRLGAAGLAGYAPLATNEDEAGRSRNRRVELVLQ
jgi:outer membrane protein OmpA-like peptidoglycan-associated protein